MRFSQSALGVLLFTALSSAQTARPAFEVATIRPSTGAPVQAVAAAGRVDGSQYQIAGLTLKDYISMAYGLKLNQISGPDWITTERFDIRGTLPEGSRTDQVPGMMQTLLEERFELKSHRDKKDFPVYALRIASGGLKINEVPADSQASNADAAEPQTYARSGSGQGIFVDYGRGAGFNFANNKLELKKLTMAFLAGTLERFLDRPVLDMTSQSGAYDFSIDLAPDDYRVMLIRAATAAGLVMAPNALRALEGSPSPTSLYDGLAKAGLRVEATRAPLDVLVIDSVRKTPTEN